MVQQVLIIYARMIFENYCILLWVNQFLFLAFQSFYFSIARYIRKHYFHHPFPSTNEKTDSEKETDLPELTQIVGTKTGTKATFPDPRPTHSQEL